jgi:DNA-binding FadR family transcriptional regulator
LGAVVNNLFDSELLRFIAGSQYSPGDRLPSLDELSGLLGISVGKLREQLEVARTLGVVEVRPRTGIRVLAFDFYPAVRHSLLMALAIDPANFEAFTNLRNHIEAGFWHEAARKLGHEDVERLRELVRQAFAKLNGHPIQIPHAEHRQLHMTIFGRLDNPFVKGLLEAYWEGYEAVELNLFADYAYLQQVWQYHERIVNAIAEGDYDAGCAALVEHATLLRYREVHPVVRGLDGSGGEDGRRPPRR